MTLRYEQDSSLLSLVVHLIIVTLTHGLLLSWHAGLHHWESHLAKVKRHHVGHHTGLSWGSLATIWLTLSLHHQLLLDKLLLKILDLLMLVHHDGLINQLLLIRRHLPHIWHLSVANSSRLTHHHRVWHSSHTLQEVCHLGILLRVSRCGS